MASGRCGPTPTVPAGHRGAALTAAATTALAATVAKAQHVQPASYRSSAETVSLTADVQHTAAAADAVPQTLAGRRSAAVRPGDRPWRGRKRARCVSSSQRLCFAAYTSSRVGGEHRAPLSCREASIEAPEPRALVVTRPEMQSGSQPQARRMVRLPVAKRLSSTGRLQHASEDAQEAGVSHLVHFKHHCEATCSSDDD